MLEAVSLTVEEDAVWLLVSHTGGSSAGQKLYYRGGVTPDDPQVYVTVRHLYKLLLRLDL